MIGIGVDVVEIERFRRSLERTPTLRDRIFTAAELEWLATRFDPVPSLAVRFAAREAAMKSLGLGLGAFGFHDVSITVDPDTYAPSLVVVDRAAEIAAERGVVAWHVSLTHDGPVAIAMVVAE